MHVAATLPPLATLAPTLRYLDPLSRAVQHVDVHLGERLGERLGAEMLAQCATESAQHCSGFFAPTSAPPWRTT